VQQAADQEADGGAKPIATACSPRWLNCLPLDAVVQC